MSRIVGRVAQYDDGLDAGRPAPFHALAYQTSSDAAILMVRRNGHGGEGRSGQDVVITRKIEAGEQNMTDHAVILRGDQFQQAVAVGPKGVHQIGFARRGKGRQIDRADGGVIARSCGTDHHAPIFSASLWLMGSPALA